MAWNASSGRQTYMALAWGCTGTKMINSVRQERRIILAGRITLSMTWLYARQLTCSQHVVNLIRGWSVRAHITLMSGVSSGIRPACSSTYLKVSSSTFGGIV
ncbi:hypothetical protein B0H14DRAFT_2576145 [Mycena olivaceomarginata]|nr:hypothetical protein B0H14DRAFT_2576145 [Mycena olivaceomarginata]